MARRYTRDECIARFRRTINEGKPLIFGSAGIGLVAKMMELGGIDIIGVLITSKYRMMGFGPSLGPMCFFDSNAVVIDMANEVLAVVNDTPVMAGVAMCDPTRNIEVYMKQLGEIGISGIFPYPTICLIDGNLRKRLNEQGVTYERELQLLKKAQEMGFVTFAYASNREEAKLAAESGVDMIGPHVGKTVGGLVGATESLQTSTLDEACSKTQEIINAANEIKSNIIFMCHGGQISSPEDVAYALEHTDAVGFVSGSSIERIAIEQSIRQLSERFKNIRVKTK
jgi:predicted TIM-barrel enzyme